KEMRDRVERILNKPASSMWISTFHSACVRILRRDIDKLGYTRDFVIYDTADQRVLLKECLRELNLDEGRFPLPMLQGRIGKAKNQRLTPEAFRDQSSGDSIDRKIADIYEKYQEKLKKNNALDFDDLLCKTVELFHKEPAVLHFYQNKFQYILVDEYQDTNHIQYRFISMLAAQHRNLCVVGDDDQSIYRFRGADIRNILDFEDDFPDAFVVKLEQNYRCTQNILDAANCVIQNNRERKHKVLWTVKQGGEPIGYYAAENEQDEARFIADQIESLIRLKGKCYSDFAVLYRTNAQSRVIEEAFMRAEIPYRMYGGLKFYDRKEIKDILAYLRIIQNPIDDLSIKRVLNVPKRGIGARTVEKLEELAQRKGESLFDILCNVAEGNLSEGISKKVIAGIKDFIGLIDEYQKKKDHLGVKQLIQEVMEKSGYMDELRQENTLESRARIENLQEFLSVAVDFEANNEVCTLEEFLAGISLMSDIDKMEEGENAVSMLTLHSAKGLEFPIVFLVGLEEGLFPVAGALEDIREIEEERRLCYVGITRAKEMLWLTHARTRTIYGRTSYNQISRFVNEIRDDLICKPKEEQAVPKTAFKEETSSRNSGIYRGLTMTSNPKPIRQTPQQEIQVGNRIQHNKFGSGLVVSVNQKGENTEITVAFDQVGIKKLLWEYASAFIKIID
ncbi:MAG TPA: UvrD-helicase domain-containing protein, partial [Clostridiales bacterium]|nr:UvrD-helicase domain-containing protein [Clostridiales bacterium]